MQALSAGPRTMGELSRILRVRPPTVTKTVARLALLGFVVRKVQKDEEEDGRIVWAKLTRKGVKKVEIIKDILEEIEVDILSSLDTKERRRLKKYLNKVSGSLAISSETEAALADEPETFAAGEEPLATSRLSNAVHPLPDADTTYIALKPET